MLPLKAYSVSISRKNHVGYVNWSKSKNGYRQRPPFNVATPLNSYYYRTVSGTYVDCNAWNWNDKTNVGGSLTAATNMARARFVQKLGDSSSFGATMTAERKETWSMVVGVITKCALAARQVARLQFVQAAGTLGLPYRERTRTVVRYRKRGDTVVNANGKLKTRGRRYVSRHREMNWGQGWYYRSAASGWLMWSYGIKPLAQDIYNGMDVLQRPTPDSRVRGSGRAEGRWSSASGQTQWKVSVTVRCAADVRVNNPNLWLANKLGLVNPAQWINEAIPFSFVVDWFSNLSQVISQCTDFVGLSVTDPCTTTLSVLREQYKHPDVKYCWVKEAKIFRRTLEIPTAKLQFGFERFEWQRGLNAISLLIGFLPRK